MHPRVSSPPKNHTQLAAESEMLICPNIHKRKRQRSREQKGLWQQTDMQRQALSVETASLRGYDG